MAWLEIDKKGLSNLVAHKHPGWILRELIQNAWDEPGVSEVKVYLLPFDKKKGEYLLTVEDDAPEGFVDLRNAYTVFADTRKRRDPEVRGRFNLGEKLVLSLCREATIETTTGTINFTGNDERTKSRKKRKSGSMFSAVIRMNKEQAEEAVASAKNFISPSNIETRINDVRVTLSGDDCQVVIPAVLETEYEKDGVLCKSKRKTEIHVYSSIDGKCYIYELGLPIQEIEDKWSYDIRQKVPLDMSREQVKESFLRDVRVHVMNELYLEVKAQESSQLWVRDAMCDKQIDSRAVNHIMDMRYGSKRLVVAPGDSYGKEQAIAHGYHIISGRELSAEEWEQVKEKNAIKSSTEVFSREFVSGVHYLRQDWKKEWEELADLASEIAQKTLEINLKVSFYDSPLATASADYCAETHTMRFNVAKLGPVFWINEEDRVKLIIHELGHEGGNHLTEGYYGCLCLIGARLFMDRFN